MQISALLRKFCQIRLKERTKFILIYQINYIG